MTTDLPAGWQLTQTLDLASREGATVPYDDLSLTPRTLAYLAHAGHPGVWRHQHGAIVANMRGDDVCLATPTASGKTLVFHVAALEAIAASERGCVLALYPTKALAEEQEQRWRAALVAAGFDGRAVARVDGSIAAGARIDACKHARVIVATPDIVHAWMLPKLGQRGFDVIGRFVERLVLLVDEVHAYSGVFGTNSSFLFRRLAQARGTLGGAFRILGASATIAEPQRHARTLFGRELTIIGAEHDSSPRHPVEVAFVQSEEGSDFTSALSGLFVHLAETQRRFMAFFDSRKMAEQAGAVVQRDHGHGDGDDDAASFAHLEQARILPYRAGYESEHRALIQSRLSEGRLAGVLCTSAMELGLDIKGLDVVVLVGVPHSGTSLHQRIGRVGRAAPGLVIVVHSGSVVDDLVFADPRSLLARPLQESAIYLDSARIQYIHAMCMARPGGEYDQATRATKREVRGAFPAEPLAGWPEGFHSLCLGERGGAVPVELRDMKREAQDLEPAHAFPLRDVETQFVVELKARGESHRLGSLSHAQVMREAYPGAVYYYAGCPYRVVYVNTRRREVQVVRCRRYTTQPIQISKVAPQREIYRAVRGGELLAAECDVKIRRAVLGYCERRGQVLEQVAYPLPSGWSFPAFSRELFTTGVVLAHPLLDAEGVDPEALCAIFREAFFLRVPLDRQDLDVSSDRLSHGWGGLAEGTRILVLHDQPYGSLRLSGRMMEPGVLEAVVRLAGDIVATRASVMAGHELRIITPATRGAVEALVAAVTEHEQVPAVLDGEGAGRDQPRVLLPQSHARSATRPDSVFEVHRVFVHMTQGLSYRGVWIGPGGARDVASVKIEDVEPASNARWGTYDADDDEVKAA